MPIISECPTEQMLQRFLLGQNTPEEFAALDAHLESCEHCVAAISTLDADDSLVAAMQRRHVAGEQTAQEGDVLLTDWLKKLRPGAEASERPPSEVSADGVATVDEKPVQPGSGDTTEIYKFLSPSQNPRELGCLGRYQVQKVLGSGGMGVVFQAFDPDLKRLVALKTTLPTLAENPSAKKRFLREAQAAAAIKHDHIVTIYQVGEDHGIAYLAMEFLEGESLDHKLRREGRLSWQEALRITRESAQGLAAAHEHGLIHRDVKPGNIWLERRGDGREARDEIKADPQLSPLAPHSSLAPRPSSLAPRVKILDFGLALPTADNANLTQSGAIVGTPAFMAPEQCRGQVVDARSDLFSLGCVLYRMATGAAPFRGSHAISTLIAVATTNPRPPKELVPELPPVVCDLIMRLLAKDPDDRFPTAVAAIEAIQAIEEGRAQPVAPVRRSRRPLVWTLGGIVMACVLGFVGYRSLLLPQPSGPQKAGQAANADDPALKAVSGVGKGPRQFYADPAHALEEILDHREIAGADADTFRKWQASTGSDFRLAWLNLRQGTGPVLYNALAVREKRPRLVRFRHEAPEAGVKHIWDSMPLDGFRPLALCVQRSADPKVSSTESLLFVKEDVPMRWGVDPGSLAQISEDLKTGRAESMRPHSIVVDAHKDGTRFIPITASFQDRLWEAQYGLTAEEVLATAKAYKERGWRPDALAPYFDNGRLRFILVAVGNDDGPDWRFRMEMTLDQYKQESAAQRERGLFPLSIVSYGNDADVYFAAIWVRCREPGTNPPESKMPDAKTVADRAAEALSWTSAEPGEVYVDGAHALGEIVDFRELIGATAEELRDWHGKLDPKFRMANVSSRNGTGEVLFNAVAVQEKEPHPSIVQIQANEETTAQTWDQYRSDGFRLIVACSSLDAGEKVPWTNTRIWVKDRTASNTEYFWYGVLSSVVGWTKDKKETPKEWRPISVYAQVAPDGVLGGSITLGPGHGRAWESFHTLTQDELLAAIEYYQRKGWRPDIIYPYWKDGQVRNNLVVVDNSDKVDWRFRTNMSRAEYQKESAKQRSLGLFPLTINSYGNGDGIRYAAIFVRYRSPAKE